MTWTPPETPTPRDPNCAIQEEIKAGFGIGVEVVAPSQGATESKTNDRIPLIVTADDMDELFQTCQCLDGESPPSSTTIWIMDTVRYSWSAAPPLGLMSRDGPATLYQPPDLEIGETHTATVKVNIKDSRANDKPAWVNFKITLKRVEDCKYRREVSIEKEGERGRPSVATPRTARCWPLPEKWAVVPKLSGDTAPELRVCAGERVVFRASGADSDTIKLACGSNDCGAAKKDKGLVDEMKYTWMATLGGFPDHGGAAVTNSTSTTAVYKAPDYDPTGKKNEDTVTLTIQDSGKQASDTPLEKKILVKIHKVDLGIENVPEDEEECPGGFVGVNSDDDDKNKTADMNQMRVDHEDDLVKITLTKKPAEGKMTLRAAKGGDRIKVWEEPTKKKEVKLPATFAASSKPKPFWVEGINVSGKAADVELVLESDDPKCQDRANLTVLKVKFKEIKGLYKSDGSYAKGYKSEDDKGMIYCNWAYDPADAGKGKWSKNKQYADIEVQVEPQDAELPDSARIVWSSEDADDASNEDPNMHADAGKLLDPNDYNGVDDDGDQKADNSDGKDNTGGRDGASEWEEIEGYTLSNGNETILKDKLSRVRFNVTDEGGDNFKVIPRIRPRAGQIPCDGDPTGRMAVWKIIQLENVKMPVGNVLPYDQLNPRFPKAFVFWEIPPTAAVPNQDPMGPDDPTASANEEKYVEKPPVGRFGHAGDGGWFFMASAGTEVPAAGLTSEKLIDYNTDGDSTVISGQIAQPWVAGIIELPKAIAGGKTVDYVEIFKADGSQDIILGAELSANPNRKRVVVYAPNYHPDEEDPNGKGYKDLPAHGFNVGDAIHVNVFSPGDLVTSGVSPMVADGGKRYFQGRTIVYKFGRISTMVHELTHGLGTAHQCGNKDWTHKKTCSMTYDHYWIQDPAENLIPWSQGNTGMELCAKHILIIRKANLEDDSTAKGRRLRW